MRFDCKDLKRALQREEPEYIAALEMRSASCAECREKLRQWREISKAAHALRRAWDSRDLWPRIHQALARESVRAGKNTLTDSPFLFRLPLLGWPIRPYRPVSLQSEARWRYPVFNNARKCGIGAVAV